jgi:hypothetical protein
MGQFDAFITKWAGSGAAERANKDAFLIDLCDALGVPRPAPTTGDTEKDTYVFERDAKLAHEGGAVTIGKIDLYKSGAFILEAKQGSEAGAKKIGTAKRGTPAWNISMSDAYGQALGYARSFDTPVPFLVVCDIGHCFDLYAAFDGSWDYRPFPNAQAQRIYLRDLANEKHTDMLRKVFTDPLALDPSKHAEKITREVAGYLANLAKKLEEDGHSQETVATFLMRCLFTMFAEDVGLLPENAFTTALEKMWIPSPASFPGGIESLWRTMNDGGHLFGIVGKILRFNGGLFASTTALPLDDHALRLLLLAAKCDWSDVEPSIFGTLIERALNPTERHKLGAHYTPRAYVERLVRPTVEDPLRADWDIVQAHVRQLVIDAEDKPEKPKKKLIDEAIAEVRDYHHKLCTIRVLDPACGSGNFLYVTLDIFKRLEGEVLALLDSLGVTQQTLVHLEGLRVTPAQFRGIEIKRWAKEIAELVLWIGYLQWHFKLYGEKVPVPEPVLQDFKNIECRDAVLAFDAEEPVLDENGKPVTRWDGETMKPSAVTGEDVPDETAQVPLYRYVNARAADWPAADFIVGNPPFIGNKRMNKTLGLGYVEALRAAYPDVSEAADYVMYWWQRAATVVEAGQTRRFGLITTKSITQAFNRKVVEAKLGGGKLSLVFAVANHPWGESENGADVRIAMTVGDTLPSEGQVYLVTEERAGVDGNVDVRLVERRGIIHADLTAGVNVLAAKRLDGNRGLAFTGMYPLGQGFVLLPSDVEAATGGSKKELAILRPFYIARDLTRKDRRALAIDFYPRREDECRREFPHLFEWVLTRVKPSRDLDPVEERRTNWWLFTRPVPPLRAATKELRRYILVPRTAKRFTFQFRDTVAAPDTSVVAIATDSAFVLGVLSSRIHQVWAVRAGGRLGVGDDPRYQHRSTFLPFAFPSSDEAAGKRISEIAEALDEHRQARQREEPDLTITGIYNVLDKLRSGEALTAKDKIIHSQGIVSVLKKLHDDLDAAVLDAYGWPPDLSDEQLLEKLVALNKERADEEKRGIVRWLRPEFQNPSGKSSETMTQVTLTDDEGDEDAAVAAAPSAPPWPKKMAAQIQAVRDHVTRSSDEVGVADVARAFKGAKAKEVEEVLESLAALGVLVYYELVEGKRWRSARFTKSASVPPPEA